MKDTVYLINTLKSMKQVSNPASQLPDILGFFGSCQLSVLSRISIRSPQPSRVGGWVAEEGLAGTCDVGVNVT